MSQPRKESAPMTLMQVLGSFDLSEVIRADLVVGILMAGFSGWTAWAADDISTYLQVAASLVGVVVGAVVAGVALIAAFLSPEFLRKLRMIGREPVRYVAPFLFTGFLGVFAMFGLIVLSGLPPSLPGWVTISVSATTGLFVGWTLASIVPDFSTLIQFVRLQEAAAEVETDDVVEVRRTAAN